LLNQATAVALADPGGLDASALYVTWMGEWLFQQFGNNGSWDYKRKKNVTNQNPNQYQNVLNFGNFNFGAVMAGLGLTYYEAQNAAGIYQVYLAMRGGTPGEGFPLFSFPYGDQVKDANLVQQGFSYEQAIKSGCN
jgi:hypothetical protein